MSTTRAALTGAAAAVPVTIAVLWFIGRCARARGWDVVQVVDGANQAARAQVDRPDPTRRTTHPGT